MFPIGPELSRERDKLLRRARQDRKYQIISYLVFIFGFSLSFYLPLSVSLSEVGFFPTRFILFGVPLLVSMVIITILGNLRTHYQLLREERLFLKVYSAIEYLGEYLEDGRETDIKRARKRIESILGEVEFWRGGNLRLTKNVIGAPLELFGKVFYEKLVAAIRQGDKDDLIQAHRLLNTFAKYLLNPKPEIKDLNFLTNAMGASIEATLPSKRGISETISHSFREMNVIRNVGIITACVICGLIPALIATYFLMVSMDTAVIVFATIFGPLIAVYLTYILIKQLKETSK